MTRNDFCVYCNCFLPNTNASWDKHLRMPKHQKAVTVYYQQPHIRKRLGERLPCPEWTNRQQCHKQRGMFSQCPYVHEAPVQTGHAGDLMKQWPSSYADATLTPRPNDLLSLPDHRAARREIQERTETLLASPWPVPMEFFKEPRPLPPSLLPPSKETVEHNLLDATWG